MPRPSAVLAAVWTALLLALPASAATEGPSDVVARLNEGLLGIMQNAESLGYEGRAEAFADVLAPTYHLRVMSRASVGAYWRKLDIPHKRRLIDAFARMTYATYARRFTGYSGERFEIVGEEPSIRDLVLVRTRLVKSNGEAVDLNYLTKEYKVGWRIVDVYLDAKYSELARLRAEYTSVLKRDGFEGLIAKIEAQIEDAAGSNG
ncbi:MAG: ABC transporter substrate-binding protein [Alphaproteobacteria bacterium]|nr:ABC transporter substrate-binding protein [Alphaproteobacteria bacterium]